MAGKETRECGFIRRINRGSVHGKETYFLKMFQGILIVLMSLSVDTLAVYYNYCE